MTDARWGGGTTDAPDKLYDYDPLLAERLQVKPYSVLVTSSADWQRRRSQWARLGIRGEVKGRAENLLFGNQKQLLSYDVVCGTCGRKPPLPPRPDDSAISLFEAPAPVLATNPKAGDPCARDCAGVYVTKQRGQFSALEAGTSIFDPVLAEASYRWYSPAGGLVLDPFAGGACRGIVAWKCGRRYVGVELRHEQVDANVQDAARIVPGWAESTQRPRTPEWVQGDSGVVLQLHPDPLVHSWGPYDMLYTCPPYYDLEQYSDDPRDLANADDYGAFRQAYTAILGHACRLLGEGRYAVVVVGEARDKDGNEYGLVKDTQLALEQGGLVQHGSFIVVNPLGTLPLRHGKQWASSRAPGRHHQVVLVYRKGDRRVAAQAMEPLQLFDEAAPAA